ncbi:MAG TPA: LysR substrate-binding domain-containing protein [Pseudonocardiaceae bacterium]|jgi:DNA-binding transcriptional LysR family regulator|nr:LysR substrate-binding domain-containing protein [Pseudonocardiaceae bacterium]
MDDLELREFRYFIAVAEELNFTRAAERLGIAQPPLSSAIGKIERRLGFTLLVRTSRQVSLTPAGQVLLEQGRLTVETANAAVERTRRAATAPNRLTVAVKPGADTELLRTLIRRYAEDPDRPTVDLLFGHPGGPAAAVRAGAADVGMAHAPFDQHGLDSEPLQVEPRVAVLPADHRLAGRTELRRAELAGEPMPHWTGQADPASVAYWSASAELVPAAGPRINDMNQLLDAVALGQVVAYVPASLARQQRRDGVVFVPVTDLSPSELLVVWPAASRSRATAEFVRTAVELAATHLVLD